MSKQKFDLGDYEDVNARRERLFREFPHASIQTTPPEYVERPNGEFVVRVTAIVYRDPFDPKPGVDCSEEPYPGRTPYTKDSEAENASTSAIGRAINNVLPGGHGASQSEVAARHSTERGPVPATSAQKGRMWETAKSQGMTVLSLAETAATLLGVRPADTDQAWAEQFLSSLTHPEADAIIEALATPTSLDDSMADVEVPGE